MDLQSIRYYIHHNPLCPQVLENFLPRISCHYALLSNTLTHCLCSALGLVFGYILTIFIQFAGRSIARELGFCYFGKFVTGIYYKFRYLNAKRHSIVYNLHLNRPSNSVGDPRTFLACNIGHHCKSLRIGYV